MANKSEVLAKTGDKPYRTVLTNGRSTFIADEHEEQGGGNEGATPDELLCMSLAACTSITLRMYAVRKNWELGEISVDVELMRHEGENVFSRKINFANPQPDNVKERLLIVANKCPVHKTLSAASRIESNIV